MLGELGGTVQIFGNDSSRSKFHSGGSHKEIEFQ
jgi:hypothetical protein